MSTSLAAYYRQRGEQPGTWGGQRTRRSAGLEAGDLVAAEQMQALFGEGRHPLALRIQARLRPRLVSEAEIDAAGRLGSPFRVFTPDASPFQREVAARIAYSSCQCPEIKSGACRNGSIIAKIIRE